MNSVFPHKNRKETGDLLSILALMLICLSFLILGNILYHSNIFPATEETDSHFHAYVSIGMQEGQGLSSFLISVISASHVDILCVLLVAFSRLTKIPKLFLGCVFAYRSLLFGYCGAYIVARIGTFDSFAQGCLIWLIFFLYHIVYFAVLICLGEATLRRRDHMPFLFRVRYLITIFAEIALVILLNAIYYFLISKV